MTGSDTAVIELAAERSLRNVTDRRIRQMMWIVFAALLLDTLLAQVLIGPILPLRESVVVRSVEVLVVAVFLVFERRGHGQLLIFSFLCSVELMLLALAWDGNGPSFGALSACAGVFAIAAALCHRWQFLLIVVVHLLGLALLCIFNGSPVTTLVPQDSVLALTADALLGAICVALILGVFALDMRRFKRAAQREFAFAQSARTLAEFHASHDTLTGLPNRILGHERTDLLVAAAQEGGFQFALMHLDLSDFRFINDSLGHAAGDVLLQHVSRQLKATLGRQDTLARVGSDEFLIAVHGPTTELGVALLTQRLLAAVGTPVDFQGMEIRAEACVGISMFPGDGIKFEDLSRSASNSLHSAKTSGESAFYFSSHATDDAVKLQLRKVALLRNAHERSAVQLLLTPQYDLADARLVACEASWQWQDPEFGDLKTDELFSVAESAGLMVSFGAWMLQESCEQVQRLRRSYQLDLQVSAEVHAAHMRRGDFLGDVKRALQQSGLPASCLLLEFREQLLLQDPADIDELMMQLRKLGVRIGVRGFGAGSGNLSRLQSIQPQWLKLDLALLRRSEVNVADLLALRPLVSMAVDAGMRCCVEGVGSDAEVEQLVSLGCSRGQGPLWASALALKEFEDLISSHLMQA